MKSEGLEKDAVRLFIEPVPTSTKLVVTSTKLLTINELFRCIGSTHMSFSKLFGLMKYKNLKVN